jgi:thiol-disulfide isomerase/thioredoxin
MLWNTERGIPTKVAFEKSTQESQNQTLSITLNNLEKNLMKHSLFLTLLTTTLFVSLFSAHGRSSKSNIGTIIEDLNVRFSGKPPELKGKPYVLEFWATWCPPCRQSIPHLNEIYKKFKARGLEVIGVTDEDKQTVRNFEKTLPIDYTVAFDTYKKLNKDFGIEGIPHAMIVDTAGKIVWEGHPMGLNDTEIEAVLKK